MAGFAIVCPPRPMFLHARRRSRCWQCDMPMTQPLKMRLSRWSWWCPRCRHVVTYGAR